METIVSKDIMIIWMQNCLRLLTLKQLKLVINKGTNFKSHKHLKTQYLSTTRTRGIIHKFQKRKAAKPGTQTNARIKHFDRYYYNDDEINEVNRTKSNRSPDMKRISSLAAPKHRTTETACNTERKTIDFREVTYDKFENKLRLLYSKTPRIKFPRFKLINKLVCSPILDVVKQKPVFKEWQI